MKKNWIAVLSLALNVLLVAQLVVLGGKLETAERNLRNQINDVESALQVSVYNIERRVQSGIEEASKKILDYELQPVGIDKEAQTLEADIVLRLREWSEDTTVQLIAVVGRDTFITLLPANGLGNCVRQISIPLNQQTEVKLQAVITSGDTTTREELGGWGDISMLLPIRMDGGGGSVPYYENGSLVVGSYMAYLCDPKGQPVENIGARYRLYVNDELVMEDEQCYNWTYPCEPDALYRLTLACEDAFGLGYEFTLLQGRCDGAEDGYVMNSGGEALVLTWN